MERALKYIFASLTRVLGYTLAVVASSATFSGGTIIAALIFAIPLVNVDFGPDFVTAIRTIFLYPFISAIFVYGGLTRLGLRSISREIDLVNRSTAVEDGEVRIASNIDAREYPAILAAVNRIPRVIFFTGVSEVLIIVAVLNAYGIYLGYSWPILMWTWIACVMGLIVYPGPAYYLAEAVTGPLRIQCLRVLWEHRIDVPEVNYASVQRKLVIVSLLYLVCLGFTSVLIYINREKLFSIAIYLTSLTAMIFVLVYMLYRGVSSAFRDALDAVRTLTKGRDTGLFSPFMDREFTDLSASINQAAQTINEYRFDLETQVRARTQELRRKSAILERELQTAAKIQAGVLQQHPRPWNGLKFAVSYEPMEKVSGDYYDIFRYRNCCFVLLADVSGHGVPAALVTMAAREMFHRSIRPDLDPAYTFNKVNERLLATVTTSEYLTAVMLKVDEQNRVMYSNAAHTRSIFYHARERRFEMLHTPGMMLGALPEATGSYKFGELQLQAGDRLHLYTDGIIEQRNDRGEEFGMENFLRVLEREKRRPLAELHERVIAALREFQGDAPVDDDVCFVTVELDENWDKFIKRYNQGVRALRDRDWHAARAELLRSSALIPHFPFQKYFLARIYHTLGDHDKALRSVQAYIDQMPEDERARKLKQRILQEGNFPDS